MAEKKKSKLGAKAIFARILAVILVTAIGGVASFFGFKTYFLNKLKKILLFEKKMLWLLLKIWNHIHIIHLHICDGFLQRQMKIQLK